MIDEPTVEPTPVTIPEAIEATAQLTPSEIVEQLKAIRQGHVDGFGDNPGVPFPLITLAMFDQIIAALEKAEGEAAS